MTDDRVTNFDPQVNELLDRHVPLRLDAATDWPDALRRAGGGRMRVRSRRVLALALGIAILVVAGAAAAGGFGLRWWDRSPLVDTTRAQSLVEYRLTRDSLAWKAGDEIALWRMPQADGSVCFFAALASPRPTGIGSGKTNPINGGGFCAGSGPSGQFTLTPKGEAIQVMSTGASLENGGSNWLVNGLVSPASGITRLELHSATRRMPLAYSNRWFIAELPRSSSAVELPKGGPYVLVGYDSHGKVVARHALTAP